MILLVIVLAWGFVPVGGDPRRCRCWSRSPPRRRSASAPALSAINVRYRDVRYVVPFAIQMWLFVTPVVYPSSLIDEPWRTLSAINPMVGVVEGFRWATLGTGDAPWDLIGVSAARRSSSSLAGLAYFDRVERALRRLRLA